MNPKRSPEDFMPIMPPRDWSPCTDHRWESNYPDGSFTWYVYRCLNCGVVTMLLHESARFLPGDRNDA